MISGFTIIRNAIMNDYPIVEAITSILPVVDEMIVLIGDCEDDTESLINGIGSAKIKIHHSVWNPNLRKGGAVLADETNKAFKLIDSNANWAFYIQGDEVIHEKYHAAILEGCKQYGNDKKVEGLLFNYLHFYGTYNYVGDSRRWYNKEVRIIRNDPSIQSYLDAQGFRVGERKLNVKLIDAFVYHYGWVKSPLQMQAKMKHVYRYWLADDIMEDIQKKLNDFNFNDFDSLAQFTGSHPTVMKPRIDGVNWKVDIDISRKKLKWKHKILGWVEKKTGIRLFSFKNYKII